MVLNDRIPSELCRYSSACGCCVLSAGGCGLHWPQLMGLKVVQGRVFRFCWMRFTRYSTESHRNRIYLKLHVQRMNGFWAGWLKIRNNKKDILICLSKDITVQCQTFHACVHLSVVHMSSDSGKKNNYALRGMRRDGI